jgi:hypothetical protein
MLIKAEALTATVLALVLALPAAAEESIFDEENTDFDGKSVEVAPPLDPATVSGSYTLAGSADTSRDVPGEAVYELRNRLDLRSWTPLSETTSVVLQARFLHLLLVPLSEENSDTLPGNFDDVDSPYAPWRAELGDAFLSSRFGNLLLRVGQQRVVWGRTDVARPLDLINPGDFRDPAGDMMGAEFSAGSTTLPIFMAKAEYVGSLGTAQAVLIPFFVPHRFALVSGDFAVASPANPLAAMNPVFGGLSQLDKGLYDSLEKATIGTEVPDETPENASGGIRLTSTAARFDLGLSYLFAWDRTPSLTLDPDLAKVLSIIASDEAFVTDFDAVGLFTRHPEVAGLQAAVSERARAGQEVFSIRYERWHVLGADMQTYLGPVGLRADLAWTPGRNFITPDFQSLRRSSLNTALGLSYEAGEGELALLAEGFWLHTFRKDGDTVRELPLVFGRDFTGLTLGLRLDLELLYDVPFVVQAGGTVFLKRLDFVFAPQLTWRVAQSVRIFAGAQFYQAPPKSREGLTIGDLFDTTDQVFVGFQQSF